MDTNKQRIVYLNTDEEKSSTESTDETLKPAESDNEDAQTYDANDSTCFLCHESIYIYSIGACDHPICFACSARLRVLCNDNNCPICQKCLPKVMFTHARLPFEQLEAKRWRDYSYNQHYNIGFCGKNIERDFFRLTEHGCPICDVLPFANFVQLEKHLYHRHKLFYCDICVQYLKKFTHNRLCYTSSDLKVHCSEGDAGDTELRGHPFCKFCRKRFLDEHDLYEHMRATHYYCVFCENGHRFYSSYTELEKHFKEKHFVCHIGVCANRQYVNAFGTEIDYSLHLDKEHADELYQYGPAPVEFQSNTTLNKQQDAQFEISDTDSSSSICSLTDDSETQILDLENEKEFPYLNVACSSIYASRLQSEAQNKKKLIVEAFPALGNNYKNRKIVTADFVCEPSNSSLPADKVEIPELPSTQCDDASSLPSSSNISDSASFGISMYSHSVSNFPPLPKHFSSEEIMGKFRGLSLSYKTTVKSTPHFYLPPKECFPDFPPWRNKKNAFTQVTHEDILRETQGLPIIAFKSTTDDLWHMDNIRNAGKEPTKILNFSENDFPCLSACK